MIIIVILFALFVLSYGNLFLVLGHSDLSIFARDRKERFGEFCLHDSHVLKTCCGDVFGDVKPDQKPNGTKHA